MWAADAGLRGYVRDENEAPVAGARVSVRPAASSTGTPSPVWQTQTNPEGAYAITLPAAGDYLVGVEREGYYELKGRPMLLGSAAGIEFDDQYGS
jgi:Carboxypeptidase regulatory-like domain